MHNTYSKELIPWSPSPGMQNPIHAAPNMHIMVIDAWNINITYTTATYSAVYCTTHYAEAIQHDTTHVIPTITCTTQCFATNQMSCNAQLSLQSLPYWWLELHQLRLLDYQAAVPHYTAPTSMQLSDMATAIYAHTYDAYVYIYVYIHFFTIPS